MRSSRRSIRPIEGVRGAREKSSELVERKAKTEAPALGQSKKGL